MLVLPRGRKFTAAGRLVMPMAVTTARGRNLPAAPPDYFPGLGLAAWLRADRGVTQSSGLVSQWNDLSGNGVHLTSSGARRPTITASTPEARGWPTIDHDAVDDQLANASFAPSAPQTVYIACTCTTGTVLGFQGAPFNIRVRIVSGVQAMALDTTSVAINIDPTVMRLYRLFFNGAASTIYEYGTGLSASGSLAGEPWQVLETGSVGPGFQVSNTKIAEFAIFAGAAVPAYADEAILNYMAARYL